MIAAGPFSYVSSTCTSDKKYPISQDEEINPLGENTNRPVTVALENILSDTGL